MNIKYIESIIDNTKKIFKDMMVMNITPETPIVYNKDTYKDINIIVGIEGDLHGSLIFSINKDIATVFTRSFIDESSVEESDVTEVISELINKITIETKKSIMDKKINKQKEKFFESNLELEKDVSYIKIPFKTDNGDFYILAGLEES